jgi:hypothetical protein
MLAMLNQMHFDAGQNPNSFLLMRGPGRLRVVEFRVGSLTAPHPSDEPASAFRRQAELFSPQFRAVSVTQFGDKQTLKGLDHR